MTQATIIIHDEVNIKIEGLELDVRRALVNRFKYLNPAARYLPAVRLGRWDGKVAYFQLGGSTYVNLLPEIVPILDEYGYDIELDDRRTYSTKFDFALMAEDTFSDRTWPPGHERAGRAAVHHRGGSGHHPHRSHGGDLRRAVVDPSRPHPSRR